MAYSNLAIQLTWWIGPGLSSELLKANFQDNHFQLNEFLVVISDLWNWLSFSKLLEKTQSCFMIGFSAGYDFQSCITPSQAALYVLKIGMCGELDGPLHKVNTLAKIITWWRQANHRSSRPILSSSRTHTPLKRSVLTDIKAHGLNLVSEFPQLQKIMDGHGFIVSCPRG